MNGRSRHFSGHFAVCFWGALILLDSLVVHAQIPDDFDPGPNNTVYALALQADGKVLVGGDFTALGGHPRNRVARLHSDGSLDTSFNPGVNNSRVNCLTLQADGKILVGGRFTSLGGQRRAYIGRLNVDGTVDSSFDPEANGYVNALAVQVDGKILVAGGFWTIGGQTRYHIGRLNTDGTLDNSFDPGVANSSIHSLVVQVDGKILLGGSFTILGGQTRNYIGRLNADGTLDTSFDPGADSYVDSLALQADGKIVVGGSFSTLGGQPRDRIARLNAEGTLDSSFNPGANNAIQSLVVQADGKVLVGGFFTTIGGQTRNRIARLNSDGTLDGSFNLDPSGSVNSLVAQADGKVLVGGSFTTIGGQARDNLARFFNDEATSGLSVTGTSQLDWQRGGSTPEIEQVSFDYWNGAGWTEAGTPSRVAGGWRATEVSLPPSTWVRARGRSSGGNYNGSSGLIEQISNYGGTAFPDIKVTLNGGDPIGNGLGQLNFGSIIWKEAGAEQTVTLNNVGTAPLMGLSLELVGPAAGDFSVSTLSTTTLAPGQSASFSVSFTALQGNERNAALRILSNDGDESPFELQLVGKGLRSEETFNPGANGHISSLAVQADRKILVGGNFTTLGGQPRIRIARLHADGTLDSSFDPMASSTVNCLAVQADGKVLVGGNFTTLEDQARNRLARLNVDGTLDSSFDPGANGEVSSLALQADGKVVVGGNFTTLGGQTRNRIARLNADGTLDSSFDHGANGEVSSLALQADGKVLLGGFFTTIGGQPRDRIARLNADGTVDSSFNPGATGSVSCVAVQPDGKILVGGSFTTLGGQTRNRIARLNADGTLDSNFNPGANSEVSSLAVQANSKILVGGRFISLGGQARNYVARLNADGTLDSSFDPGADTTVTSLALQADGKVLVGGNFSILGGQPRDRIARLLNDQATSELSVTGSGQIDWQRGGSGAEVERVTFDFWDGESWSPAGTPERAAGGWRATGLSLTENTWVRAQGRPSGGYLNGSSGLIEEVVSINADLSALVLSSGALAPTFLAATTSYTAIVTNATDSITITPTRAEGNAAIEARINEGIFEPITSGSPSGSLLLNVGDNSIELRVTAQSGKTKIYTVTVTRDKAAQVITFSNPGDQLAPATLILAATGGGSSSGVTYEVLSGPGILTNGNELSFSGGGSVTVRASQAGDDFHVDADPVEQTFEVILPRPDVAVGRSPSSLVGSEVYSTSPQVLSLVSTQARQVTGYASLANRVMLPDDRATDAVLLRGGRGNAYFKITYLAPTGNVTASVLAGTYQTPAIDADDAPVLVRATVTPNKKKLTTKKGKRTIYHKKTLFSLLRASSKVWPAASDSASLRVQTK